MDNFITLALQHKEKGEWQEYVNTMLVRNDWLEENGKPRETELYLLSNGSYSDYEVVGVYEGVIGLDLKEIQKQFYKRIIKETGYKGYDWSINLQPYVDLYGGLLYNEERIFIGYLIKDLGLKKRLDIEEINLEDISLITIANEPK